MKDCDSGHICSDMDCGGTIWLADDEVVLIQVVVPQLKEDKTSVVYPAFEDEQGNYAYIPHIYHVNCWGEIEDRLREAIDEYEIKAVNDPYKFEVCAGCSSDLRLHEPTGLLTHGEYRRSIRTPQGHEDVEFKSYAGASRLLCLSCLRIVNHNIIEMWPDGISYSGECKNCTTARIWRMGLACEHIDEDEEYGTTDQEDE